MTEEPHLDPCAAPSAPLVGDAPGRAYSLGALALGGLFGGPLAFGYLAYRDFVLFGLRARRSLAIALFVAAAGGWALAKKHTPDDVLSNLLTLVPQLLLWWIAARYLLTGALARHADAGGKFRSLWVAVAIGLAFNLGMRLCMFAFSALAAT